MPSIDDAVSERYGHKPSPRRKEAAENYSPPPVCFPAGLNSMGARQIGIGVGLAPTLWLLLRFLLWRVGKKGQKEKKGRNRKKGRGKPCPYNPVPPLLGARGSQPVCHRRLGRARRRGGWRRWGQCPPASCPDQATRECGTKAGRRGRASESEAWCGPRRFR